MKHRQKIFIALVCLLGFFSAGCGHWPSPIDSNFDIMTTRSTEKEIVICDLPLRHYKKLEKFKGLESVDFSKTATDATVEAFAQLRFPNLHSVYLLNCTSVGDAAILSLRGIRSINMLHLENTAITDNALLIIANDMPQLQGINVSYCPNVTFGGMKKLSAIKKMDGIVFSVKEPVTDEDVIKFIFSFYHLTDCGIDDKTNCLNKEKIKDTCKDKGVIVQFEGVEFFKH